MSLVLTLCTTILELTSYTPKSGSSAVEVTGATKNCAYVADPDCCADRKGLSSGKRSCHRSQGFTHSNRNLILILLMLDKIKIK